MRRSEYCNSADMCIMRRENIIDLTNAFADAVAESDFFQKMLGMTQDEQETPKKATKSKKEVEEVAEEE